MSSFQIHSDYTEHMELLEDYEPLPQGRYSALMVKRLMESTIKNRLYDKLCKQSKKTVVMLEWKGRLEKQTGQRRVHRSLFTGEFDLAVFKRTRDRKRSPVLIGYEVKGLRKYMRKKDGKIIYRRPLTHGGRDQARLLLEEDANKSYLVTIPRDNESENQSLINMVKDNPNVGLIYAEVKNRRTTFRTIIEPKLRDSMNQDRKKVNLGIVSMWERPLCTKIRRQEWARKCEFVLS